MDVAAKVNAAVLRFPKGHKHTLGARLRATIDIVLLVARANRRDRRALELAALCDRVEELKVLVNPGKEVKAFSSFKQYAEVVEQAVSLARQAEAWRRSIVSKERPEPARPSPRGGTRPSAPGVNPCGSPACLLGSRHTKAWAGSLSRVRERTHDLLHALLEPAFDPSFSEASFACRRGKGTHAAAAALQTWMWHLSRHGGQRVFALQLDVVNFFMSLHKPTLRSLLEPATTRLKARLVPRLPPSGFGPWQLTERIVRHEPSRSARRVGPAASFRRVPAHKRLGAPGPDRGLPIGNLTSQFFANVYLSPLDHFVQRTLGVRGYVRYVDDFVLLDASAERLEAYRARVVAFLRERLTLAVRAEPIVPASRGVDFVGYVLRPSYVLPRRRVVEALRACLDGEAAALAPVEVPARVRVRLPRMGAVRGPVRVTRLDSDAIERLRARWSSYEGHLVHARAHRLRETLWNAHPACSRLLRRCMGRMRRRFVLSRPMLSFAAQVRRLGQGPEQAGNVKRRSLAYLYEPVGLAPVPPLEPSHKEACP